MNFYYQDKSLVEIARDLSHIPKQITLTGKDLSISEILAVARHNTFIRLTDDPATIQRIRDSFSKMIQDIENGIPIYGTNTGYGAQAARVLTKGSAKKRMDLARKISEGIVHVDITTGPTLSKDIIRAAILIRINMLMQGVSAVKLEDLKIYQDVLNHQITPIVNQYGGIGASGDLAHNGRVLSALRGLKGVKVWDKNDRVQEAKQALKSNGIPSLKLDPKAGLALVNGDNFSTSMAALLAFDTLQALIIACVAGALTVEALKGTDRSFHPMLSQVRPHLGQMEVSSLYRYLLLGSKLAYQEMRGHNKRPDRVRVQDGYSLRGISQYHGVNFEKIKLILESVSINANSSSDNPLWVSSEQVTEGEKPWQWVSGGNFLAMHMVEAIDNLRKIMTQIVKLNDRHLARLVNPFENNGLPANLSDKKAITGCSFKGVQIQSGMFDVYSSLLSIPVSTFFGVHEEGNQDISSHALTSGILGLENLRLVRYSLAQNLLALAQAIDLRGGMGNLSKKTLPVYKFIRSKVAYVKTEKPLFQEIETIFESIKNGTLMQVIRQDVFSDFKQ